MLRSPRESGRTRRGRNKVYARTAIRGRREQRARVPFEDTKKGDTAFPLYEEIETTGGEMPYRSRNRSEDFMALDREKIPYDREFTTEFEKPGFLRTAEEKVQDKNALRTAERVSKRMSQSKLVILSARGES